MTTIKELQPRKGFDTITATVVSVGEPRQVRDGTLTVAEAELKDATGTVKLSLWNDDVNKVKPGDTVTITKGWTNEFQGNLSVSAGKFGTMEVVSGKAKAPAVEKAIDEDII
jgi:replication factor A1